MATMSKQDAAIPFLHTRPAPATHLCKPNQDDEKAHEADLRPDEDVAYRAADGVQLRPKRLASERRIAIRGRACS